MTMKTKENFKEFNNNIEEAKDKLLILLKSNLEKIDKLLEIKDKTYENFIYPMFDLENEVSKLANTVSHINSVNNSEKSQKAINEILPDMSKYETKISTDTRIYNVYKMLKKEQYDKLDNEQKKVIDDSILYFKLAGADLSDEDKEKLGQINESLDRLSKDFEQNIINSNKDYKLIIKDFEDVKELPKNDLQMASFDDNGKTAYKFTLQAPSYIAYMTYGNNRDKREELYKAYSTRASENAKVIDELLKLKQEQAKLLGFSDYASYSNAFKDATNIKEVEDFLENLSSSVLDTAKKEYKNLEEFAGHKLESYDSSYYSEKLRVQNFSINEEFYQDYFEKTAVLQGVLNFLEKSFNIKIKKIKAKSWHKQVEVFDFYNEDKAFGRMYFDLEAREGKRDGAWMNDYETHYVNQENQISPASAFIVCNFPPSSEDKPSLLRHRDVETLFHEIGHGIHHIFSTVKQRDISGVNGIKWDVVEFPSQFLEQFAYDKETIKMFASHYKTKEPLKNSDIDKLIKARNFQSAMHISRQCEFSIFDIKLHKKLYQGDEVQKLLDETRIKHSVSIPPKYNKFQNAFSHIFAGGYSAGYYSYKWAEVLSADLYLESKKQNIWKKYLENVLYLSSSYDMSELFFNILGRKVRDSALLELNMN